MQRTSTGLRAARRRTTSLLLALALALTGLAGLVASAGPAAADACDTMAPGTWLGSWISDSQALGGSVKADYSFPVGAVSGAIEFVHGQSVVGDGTTITGTRTGCTFTATVGSSVTITGTVAASGTQMSGTWDFSSGLVTGTWNLGLTSDSASGDGSATTDADGTPGPTASDPIETTVMSPNAGPITIDEAVTDGGTNPGYQLLGTFVRITAPTASKDMPLTLTFDIDGSQTAGVDLTSNAEIIANLSPFRDGTRIADKCTPVVGATTANPITPCIQAIETPGNGRVRITVLTAAASLWSFGVPNTLVIPPPPPTGPGLQVSNVSVREGNRGAKKAMFVVTLSAKSLTPVTVHYATQSATALAGSDFTSTSGTLIFRPRKTKVKLKVPVLGDRVREGTETFRVVLSNPTNAHIVQGTGIATIRDND